MSQGPGRKVWSEDRARNPEDSRVRISRNAVLEERSQSRDASAKLASPLSHTAARRASARWTVRVEFSGI